MAGPSVPRCTPTPCHGQARAVLTHHAAASASLGACHAPTMVSPSAPCGLAPLLKSVTGVHAFPAIHHDHSVALPPRSRELHACAAHFHSACACVAAPSCYVWGIFQTVLDPDRANLLEDAPPAFAAPIFARDRFEKYPKRSESCLLRLGIVKGELRTRPTRSQSGR